MRLCFCLATLLASVGLFVGEAGAGAVLAPGDSVIGIDTDGFTSNSSYPAGEPPTNVADNTLNKYLNFGAAGSGFIATPSPGALNVESIVITTANDAPERDPFSFALFGTNDPITSVDNSTGEEEDWTFIDGFDISAVIDPLGRDTASPAIDISNGTAWTSYRMVFPTLRDAGSANSMQVAEVDFFLTDDGSGVDVLTDSSPIIAIHQGPDSRSPGAEGPANVIDGDSGTKYLNFGTENSGFIVTPAAAHDPIIRFQITTANDADARDPTSWELYGTDDPITSQPDSDGSAEDWSLIDSGSVDLPLDRFAGGPFVEVDNDTVYSSYRMVFPTLRNAAGTDSMQIADIQFYDHPIPEPSTLALSALGLAGIALAIRRRK